MDARNRITQDMLQPKVRRSFSDEEGSSEDLLELSDVDSESSDIRLTCAWLIVGPGDKKYINTVLNCIVECIGRGLQLVSFLNVFSLFPQMYDQIG